MKIVAVDSYDRENISDTLICENINGYYGNKIVKLLNAEAHGTDKFFELKEDNYKLYDASQIY